MPVDIVIPVYGRYDLLEKCLDSLEDAFKETKYKVYIYDNDSPIEHEEKVEFFKKYKVRVTYGKNNAGFVLACNAAARKGRSKYIFFLNSDVVLHEGSGDTLVKTLSEDEKIGVVGMKLMFPDDVTGEDAKIRPPGKVQHVGISFDIKARPKHLFVGWSPDNPKTKGIIEPPAVTGAALMTRRSIWFKAKGFDTDYNGGYFEDVDYCLKAKHLGYRIIVPTSATGTHYVGASATEEAHFPLEFNKQIFYNKWMGRGIVWTDGDLL